MARNPGQEAASGVSRAVAELQQTTSTLALPAMRDAAAAWLSDLGTPGQLPESVRTAFSQARTDVNQDAAASGVRGAATIRQAALQSGMGYNPGALSEATDNYQQQLEQIRIRRLRSLQFQEAQAGQGHTNALLGQLIGTGGNILGGAGGYGANALQGANLLNQAYAQQSSQNATYGSIAGTIIGGALGMAGGNPMLGASLGGAAGGAIGGSW